MSARYTFTQNIDEPLAMQRSGSTSYYQADALGSVTSLTSSAGSVANTYTYDSFGNVTNSTGSLRNPFFFAGREYDNETSLYFNRARYYSPSTGRFISEDPIRFWGGANFYSYVSNNPTNLIDPSGLCDKAASTGNISKGTILGCAAALANGMSLARIARLQSNNTIGQALLGNMFSGAYEAWNTLSHTSNAGEAWTVLATNGLRLGLPGGGPASKGLFGVGQDAILAAAFQNLGSRAASTAASAVGWGKAGYDAATFAYSLAECVAGW